LYVVAQQKTDQRDPSASKLVEESFRETRSDPVCNYKFRILKAQILVSRRPKETLELLAVPVPPELVATEFEVREKLLQGQAHSSLGAYHDAKLTLDEAERLAASRAQQLLAKISLAKGDLANRQGNQAETEQDYMRGLSLARQYSQKPAELEALADLGFILERRERFDEATDMLSKALEQSRILHNRVVEETALGNLGYIYFQLGDFDRSISLLQQAERTAAEVDEKRGQQRSCTVLGNVYLSKRDYIQAEVAYSKALSLALDLNRPDVIDADLLALAYHNLAQLELARESPDKAEQYNRRAFAAENLSLSDLSDPYLVLTTAEIAKARRQFSVAEDLLNDVLRSPKTDTTLRWQAESDLANVYVVQNKFPEAEREFQKALEIVEKASEDVKQEERRMSILDAWPFYDDYIRFLVDRNNPAKALQIAEFSRARTLAEAFGIKAQQRAAGLSIAALQRSLGARNQIVLAYWVADKESYLWAITPTQIQLFPLPAKDQIEAAIKKNTAQIEERLEPQESAAAQQLYAMLVERAAALIPKNARVVIAPNRSLYKLNFETLVVPGARPHYWIEDAQIENASSLALLAASRRERAAATSNLLLIGAPLEATIDFPALKHAPEEMQKVKSHFPGGRGKIVAGKDATPPAYRASRPGQYRFIHFVSHGTANQMSPLDSAIILSADAENSYKLYARDVINASQRPEDRLHADLVTISACYGLGNKTYSGEGLVGLAWAFMRAGAHQVIAGLWDVDDASSPQFMDDFYSELSRGKSVADALRHAKLNMLGSSDFHKHPHFWASLQVYSGG
jgi:CHAT domain-containing protein